MSRVILRRGFFQLQSCFVQLLLSLAGFAGGLSEFVFVVFNGCVGVSQLGLDISRMLLSIHAGRSPYPSHPARVSSHFLRLSLQIQQPLVLRRA